MPNFEQLETHILNANFNKTPEIADLFSDDFKEVSPTGSIVHKESVVAWLKAKSSTKQWQLFDFEHKYLNQDTVLCTYKTTSSVRSSIWQKHDEGWQMIFAQGTLISK